MLRIFTAAGAFAAFLGMLFGAFGTHALRPRIPPDRLAIYETGVRYHLLHALALILIGVLSERLACVRLIRWTGGLMIAGIVIFSGSLYALAISGVRLLGAITPVGGFCFLVAWLLLGIAALRRPPA